MAHTTRKGEAFTWHHVSRARATDVAFVVAHFGMSPRDAALLTTREDVPCFYDRGTWHMVRLYVPSVGSAHNAYEKLRVAIVFDRQTVVTVTDGKVGPLEALLKSASRSVPRELRSGNVGDVIAWLLLEICDGVDPILTTFLNDIERLGRTMHAQPGDTVTRALGALHRDVLMLDMMAQPAAAVLDALVDTETPYRPRHTTATLRGIADRLRAMHAILEHDGKLLDALGREHENMLSHRTNQTVQFLTVISVLLMPPTLVASYYGMNVTGLPWAHDIRVVSAVIAVAIVVFLFVVGKIVRK